jgi:predicted phage terminase large subunit-like protein
MAKYGERGAKRADAAPRGTAKSTLRTLIKPLHDACYGLEQFILILSSTTPLANKKLKDIRSEVRSNSKLRDVFQLRFLDGRAGESQFTLVSKYGVTHFMALGKGAEVRGIRYMQHRPTKIISDDVEHSDEVYNEVTRQKTKTWYFEDVSKAGTKKTNFEFIGTVLHPDSLLSDLLRNPAYTGKTFKSIISWSEREDLWNTWRQIYRNIDNPDRATEAQAFYEKNKEEMLKGTEVIWPEREDYLYHMKDIEEIGLKSFMKEKQNDPQGSDDLVFDTFHYYTETNEGMLLDGTGVLVPKKDLVQVIASVDPSTGKASHTSLGDYTCMLIGYKDIKGRLYVHKDFTKRVSPTKYINEIFNLWEVHQFEQMAVETNLYRNLLMQNILDEKRRRQEESKKEYRIAFYEVEQTENKIERITRLEPKVNHGWVLFNKNLSKDFMNMMRDFPKNKHDDGPDALEILWSLAHNRYKPSAVGINAMAGR